MVKKRPKNISDVISTYPGLLYQCTWSTAQMHKEILDTCALDSLLLTDLATHACSAPDVQDGHELGQRVHDAALAQLLGVLPEGVAWHDVRDDACKEGEETRESKNKNGGEISLAKKTTRLTCSDISKAGAQSVRPIVRHFLLVVE